jgi:hypothetical protein
MIPRDRRMTWVGSSRLRISKARLQSKQAATIRPAAFSHKTSRKSRSAALQVPAAATAGPRSRLAAAAPAGSRTSSNRPACHPQSGQSAHRDRRARSRSWAAIWFAPRPVTRSGESKTRASSSASLARLAPAGPLNRIGQKKSTAVVGFERQAAGQARLPNISPPNDFDQQIGSLLRDRRQRQNSRSPSLSAEARAIELETSPVLQPAPEHRR